MSELECARKEKFDGIQVVVGCFLILFVAIGSAPTVSVFMPELLKALDTKYSNIAPLVTVSTMTAFFVMQIAPKIVKKYGPRKCMMFGTICVGMKFLLYGCATAPWHVVWFNAFSGFGYALSGASMASDIISAWYFLRKKFMITLVSGGFGLGTALWVALAGILIEHMSWRYAYWTIGAIVVVVGIGANLILVRNTPAEKGQKQLGWKEREEEIARQKTALAVDGITIEEAHKSISFWLLAVAMLLGSGLLGAYRDFCVSMWREVGVDRLDAAFYLSFVTLVGGVAVCFSGAYNQKFGWKIHFPTFYGLFIANCVFSALLGTTQNFAFLYLGILAFALSYPVNNGIQPMLALESFGPKQVGPLAVQLHGFAYFGQAVTAPLMAFIRDSTGSFTVAYAVMGGMCLSSLVLVVIAINISPFLKHRKAKKVEPATAS
jgi:MFS family permease